jgi:hypothetical protein
VPQVIPLIVAAGAYEAGATVIEIALLTIASSIAVSIYEKEEAEAKARAAARAALQDRLVTVRSGVAPRQYVFGHCRTGGALMYVETAGAKKEALDSVTAFAANQCVLTDWFLADDRIPAELFPGDKYGRRTNAPTSEEFTVTGPSAAVITSAAIATNYNLTIGPGGNQISVPIPLHATWRQGSASGAATAVNTSGRNVTLTNLPAGTSAVTLSFQTPQDEFLRGQFKSGRNDQVVTDWSGYATPEWDSAHRLAGTTYLRTLNIWDSNAYQNGAPAITAGLIGQAIDGFPFYDPRDNSHPTDTSNPAIIAGYWMTLPRNMGGMGIATDWIDWTTVAAAANVCDELVTVKTVAGNSFETIHRYSCDTVLSTDLAPRDNLLTILSSMAGTYAFTCGKYRIFAGAFRSAAVTLTDNDIIGTKPISVNTANTSDVPPNIVTCTFSDANQNWVSSSPTPVRNGTYVTADGSEQPLDLQMKATTDSRRASYLMGVALERGRPCYGVSLSVGGIGENLGLYDTVQLNLVNRSAYAGKTFEIASIVDNWDGTFDLTLSEIKPTTFALDPNTYLPVSPVTPPNNSYLWSPPAPTSFVVSAITPTTLPDGTAISRVSLAWDPIPPAGNTPGAYFNIRYRTTGGSWIGTAPIPGDQTSTTLTTALEDGEMYQFEIQFVNGIGAASDWVDAYTGIDGTPLPTPLSLRLSASSLIFRVPETGNAVPVSITLKEIRSGGLTGTAVWTTTPTTVLTGSGMTRVLQYADMAADSVLITITVTQGSDTYTDSQTILKVFDGTTESPDFTPPPTPTGLNVDAFLLTLVPSWDVPTFTQGHGYDTTIVYAAPVPASGPQPTFAQAVPVGSDSSGAFRYTTTTGAKYAFWIKHQSKDGVRSTNPAGGLNGVQAQTGVINGVDLAPGLIDASKLADGSVTATKLAAAAVDNTKLASGLQTVKVVTGALPGTNVSNVIFRTDDAKLYKWNGTTYTAATQASDIQGQLIDAQLAGINAAKIAGAITSTQIADGSISTPKLVAGSVTSAQIAADTITAANIAANAITSSELAANSVIAGKIAAAAVNAAQIAAGAITASKMLIGDTSNICTNGAFTNDAVNAPADGWQGATCILASNSPPTTNCGSFTARDAFFGNFVPCQPGMQFFCSGYGRTDASPYTSGVGMLFMDKAGNQLAFAQAYAFGPGQISWGRSSGVITAPAGAVFGWIWVQVNGPPAVALPAWYHTLIEVRRATTGELIVDGSITATKISANAIAVGTAAIQNGAIVNAMIANAAIDAAKIADANITSAKIANAQITQAHLAGAIIGSAQIIDGSITNAEIQNGAITNAKIGNLEVDSAKIANLTIGTGKISNSAITSTALATRGTTGGNNTAYISFNYTTSGGNLILIGRATGGSSSPGQQISIRRNGVAADSSPVIPYDSNGSNLFYDYSSTATIVGLGAGTYTFDLFLSVGVTADSGSLALLETKK